MFVNICSLQDLRGNGRNPQQLVGVATGGTPSEDVGLSLGPWLTNSAERAPVPPLLTFEDIKLSSRLAPYYTDKKECVIPCQTRTFLY